MRRILAARTRFNGICKFYLFLLKCAHHCDLNKVYNAPCRYILFHASVISSVFFLPLQLVKSFLIRGYDISCGASESETDSLEFVQVVVDTMR